ncbi:MULTISPECIES: DUF4232 domain-containing protein [Streptomyces]|uniref:DUF4232 domain-containing protein n=1 Tax=Streptomyces mirabilis TaxID=68239 RepID=A0ABU3UE92_9ACTN|nr:MULTISPECIES: DUF4232 domain-containing protein [Streptomyces]MCX4614075.1 DUF4232 domain-containing protein [Streptomyces mirabilis]MCX5354202.1 DUF4232 domain-containing protein [Streptomyces mirabilis]MDU8992221.1 DUF4232 domain-containing protein [Streptomyces mirabilis]QDN92093.1 DUF4232 domain-containing protein [Streptomyces sp. RLB3-6]QDO12918.1 DUF4232 domain-containing protein [Streptomyces sp. S1D4-23]
MRVHKLTFAALAVAAGLSLTACQNDNAGTGQSDPSSPSTVSSGTTASSSGGGSDSGSSDQGGAKNSAGTSSTTNSGGTGTAAGTGSNANAKVGKCRTDELEITAKDNTIDGDPDGTVVVTLTNHSGRDCTVSGYAGVDLKTSAGSLSAKRTGQQAGSAILKNGKSTYFPVNYPFNKSGGSGVRITGLVVTPPDETKSVTLNWPGAATLPVTDGSGSPVKVGPVGSAGQGG